MFGLLRSHEKRSFRGMIRMSLFCGHFSRLTAMPGIALRSLRIARRTCLPGSKPYGWNSMPVTACGRHGQLKHKGLVLERKKINADIPKRPLFVARSKQNIPSFFESNCFMVDVKRPGKQFIESYGSKKVYIGGCGQPGRHT